MSLAAEEYNYAVHAHPLAVPLDPSPEAVVLAILITGARIPVIRLKLLASASPVPRCGAGKTCRWGKREQKCRKNEWLRLTSGVYAYKTPYICK